MRDEYGYEFSDLREAEGSRVCEIRSVSDVVTSCIKPILLKHKLELN